MNKLTKLIKENNEKLKSSSLINKTILLNWLRQWTDLHKKHKEIEFSTILGEFMQEYIVQIRIKELEALIEMIKETNIREKFSEFSNKLDETKGVGVSISENDFNLGFEDGYTQAIICIIQELQNTLKVLKKK